VRNSLQEFDQDTDKESTPIRGRDKLMKFYTLDMLAKNIAQSLAKPI